jgi:hypothetical protein
MCHIWVFNYNLVCGFLLDDAFSGVLLDDIIVIIRGSLSLQTIHSLLTVGGLEQKHFIPLHEYLVDIHAPSSPLLPTAWQVIRLYKSLGHLDPLSYPLQCYV